MQHDPTTSVDQLILDHLQSATLPDPAQELVLAAMLGEQELHEALDGGNPVRPQPARAEDNGTAPAGAYLSRIEVRGFRGVGETAALDLVPGPGLTSIPGGRG